MVMKKYSIQGYVTTEVCVEIGTWESTMSLHDCWDMIIQIVDDGSYAEGMVARGLGCIVSRLF